MKDPKRKLTLDQLVTYQIKVPGELRANWLDWGCEMAIAVESHGDATPITALTGTFDQAGLHSLLRRLYSLGIPLISVQYLE